MCVSSGHVMYLWHALEDAKRFEDGLQDEKNFLYIQKRYVSCYSCACIIYCMYVTVQVEVGIVGKCHV